MAKPELPKHALIIPHRELNPDTLRSVIEQFVSRDGPDPGHVDVPMERKIQTVLSDLDRGIVVLVYDNRLGTCNIIPKNQFV